jgi:hypothetical protein
MEKLSARIENWSIVDNLIFNGYQPLEPGQRLTGYLMGHADLPNGVIYTAVIERVDEQNGLVETLNTVYRLGRVSEDYERWALGREETRVVRETPVAAFLPGSRKPAAAYPSAPSLHACR